MLMKARKAYILNTNYFQCRANLTGLFMMIENYEQLNLSGF
jgi:hypothetical protein